METNVITLENKAAGKITLSDVVFGAPVKPDLLNRMVTWQLAKRRAGTHKTKERSEVRGSTHKIYKQKGTGRARHGTRRVSQFVGGGTTFGPRVRSHAIELPKKVRKAALKSALSAKRADGSLVVVESLALDSAKTGALAKRLSTLGWASALIIDGAEVDQSFRRASANIPRVDVLPSQGANVYDILRHDTLVLTKAAVAALEARLA